MKPPVSQPSSCMQMNQYKVCAWFHRLRSHFSSTRATEGVGLLPVSHIEKTDTEARRRKEMYEENKETPGFPISGR